MSFELTPQRKTGLFVLIIILILGYTTIRLSKTSLLPGGSYTIYAIVEEATGLTKKTPVQIAGVQVGFLDDIELVDGNKARLSLAISRGVKVSRDVEVRIRSIGFLGDTYIDLYQPGGIKETMKNRDTAGKVTVHGDISSVTGQLSEIAADVKAITGTMRTLMAGEDSSFAKTLKNIERITSALENVSTKNEANLNAIIANMRAISENLNAIVARNMGNVDATLDNVAVVTDKIKRGEGSLGRLINDDETVEKLNDSLDNLNSLLGGANKLSVDVGYHTEYLGQTEEFKHYVSLALKPKPDKFFLIEFVDDPSPDSTHTTKESTITSGGVTTTVTEEVEKTETDKFRFSAQLAKKYYGFTFRGGLIESSGGAGIDYNYGPVGVEFSAFDFETKRGERPHLKAMGTVNLSKSFYLLGGLDDFISKEQDPDWFFGAGVKITDDDLKSLLGLFSAKP
ncbi:MAG: MCE family protein [Deltaproteobacteria bacterium]|nr:MCE family protein [Deltaproteobacteria bacterium]